MAILDHRESLEEVTALAVRLGRGELAVQEGGVTLVAVVLVPRGLGGRPLLRCAVRHRPVRFVDPHHPIFWTLRKFVSMRFRSGCTLMNTTTEPAR